MSEAIHPTTTATETERAAASARQAARSLVRSLARPVASRPLKETNFNGFQAIWTEKGRRRTDRATERPSEATDAGYCALTRCEGVREGRGKPFENGA